jgi:hypothetical protein
MAAVFGGAVEAGERVAAVGVEKAGPEKKRSGLM